MSLASTSALAGLCSVLDLGYENRMRSVPVPAVFDLPTGDP